MNELEPLPLDEQALRMILEALDFHWVEVLPDGTHVGSGDFSLHQLLEFWSGYDGSLLEDTDDPMVKVYPGSVYNYKDLIRVLVLEVLRLRGEQVNES